MVSCQILLTLHVSFTILGELKERRKAVEMILYKILENPDSACYSNCSYSQVREPVASAFSIGSPFAITYRPPVDMNYSIIDSECKPKISASSLPDASLSVVAFEHESTTNQIDPLLCNQSLSISPANANLDSSKYFYSQSFIVNSNM